MISIRFRDVEFKINADITISVSTGNDAALNVITLEELEQAVKIAQIMKRDLEVRNVSRTN